MYTCLSFLLFTDTDKDCETTTDFDFSSIPIIIEDTAQPLQQNHGSDFVEVPDSVFVEDPLNDVKEEKTLSKSIPSPIDSGGLDKNSASSNVQNQSATVYDYKSKFDCRICQLPFSSKQGYNSHISKVHIKTQYLRKINPASDTKQMFMDRKEHAKEIKHATEKFVDEANNSIQQGKENIGNKYITADPVGKFTCATCNSVFKQSRNLTRHFQTVHEKLKPFECAVCKRYFSSKQVLKRHHVNVHEGKQHSIHEGKKSFQCSQCDVKYKTRTTLKKHIIKSHNINTHHRKDTVHEGKQHEEIETAHEANKPKHKGKKYTGKEYATTNPNGTFNCTICNAVFNQLNSVTRHFKTVHEPFECNACEGCFSAKHALKTHYAQAHEGRKKQYQCNLCSRIFSSKQYLTKHMKKKHVSETACDSNITNHRKELNSFIQGLNETYSCDPCNRLFINEEKFMEHAKIIHKENHKKIDIQEVSDLSVHEEENLVLCDLCNIVFSSQEQFRIHFETMHEDKGTEDNNIEFAPSQQ